MQIHLEIGVTIARNQRAPSRPSPPASDVSALYTDRLGHLHLTAVDSRELVRQQRKEKKKEEEEEEEQKPSRVKNAARKMAAMLGRVLLRVRKAKTYSTTSPSPG